MRNSLARVGSMLLLVMGIAYGCEDERPLVAPSGGPRPLLDSLTSTITTTLTPVSVLTRNTPLADDVTVSGEIGKLGGEIAIPEAGVKVVFPADAVNRKVTISVTAIKGSSVAYEFEPHGLKFRQPVMIMQSYKDTPAWTDPTILAQVEGGYFASTTDLNTGLGKAKISEFEPISLDVTGSKIKFYVEHFSGYLVVSGRDRDMF